MTKFRHLFVINLRAMLTTSRGKNKKRAVSGFGALALMGFVAAYLSCLYSFAFAEQLSAVGMTELVLTMMPVLVLAIGLLYTVFAVQGVVFGGKDNDLMLALPISSFSLMLSRVTALLCENLVFSLFVMLPAGVAYFIHTPGASPLLFLWLVIASFFLALLPTTLALILGFALSWLSGRFTPNALGKNLLYFVFFAVVMLASFKASDLMNSLAAHALGVADGFNSVWGAPFLLYQQAVCGDLLSLLLFIALCVAPFLLVVWLFGRRYKHLVTSLNSHKIKSDYRLGQVRSTSRSAALLAKEARRYFGMPLYLFNTAVGEIMLLIAAVAALVKREFLLELLGEFAGFPVVTMLALLILFMLSISAISASSISLEGRYLWILREAPVSSKELLSVKWKFQVLVLLPVTALCLILLSVAFSLNVWQCAALILMSAAFTVGHAIFGVLINLAFPRLDAVNETVIIKQSGASMLGSFLPLLALLPCVGLYFLTQSVLSETVIVLLCAVFFAVVAVILYRVLNTRGVRMLESL